VFIGSVGRIVSLGDGDGSGRKRRRRRRKSNTTNPVPTNSI
jgi:hypothetical protein